VRVSRFNRLLESIQGPKTLKAGGLPMVAGGLPSAKIANLAGGQLVAITIERNEPESDGDSS
jgi:hypothetical protein